MRLGFSLLEISVVLTIIAIVLAGGLTLGTAKTEQTRLVNAHDEMKEISKAISIYVNTYGCMLYPASLTAKPGTAQYGREPAGKKNCSHPESAALNAVLVVFQIRKGTAKVYWVSQTTVTRVRLRLVNFAKKKDSQ